MHKSKTQLNGIISEEKIMRQQLDVDMNIISERLTKVEHSSLKMMKKQKQIYAKIKSILGQPSKS